MFAGAAAYASWGNKTLAGLAISKQANSRQATQSRPARIVFLFEIIPTLFIYFFLSPAFCLFLSLFYMATLFIIAALFLLSPDAYNYRYQHQRQERYYYLRPEGQPLPSPQDIVCR
jgi:hypothetical protein